MSISARYWLTSCAVLLAVSITAAAAYSCHGNADLSPASEPNAHPPAAPVYVVPAPITFDLESDNPAD